MALAIARTLVGSATPQAVQVAVTGATIGDAYTVTGTDGTNTWTVRGGDSAVAAATTFLVVDVLSPINVPVTYTVTHDIDGATASAAALTVPYPARQVLTSIDGSLSVQLTQLRDNGAPRARRFRQALFAVQGRTTPVVRYDVPSGVTGQIVVDTDGDETNNLDALLDIGGLVVLRTDGSVRDLPAVQIMLVTSDDSLLAGVDKVRTWNLGYDRVADPEPDVVVAAIDWDDFDLPWSTDTWTNFDSSWSSGTWDQFDQFDWTTL